jgi:membrane protease YdiL (CAAX protease family)
MRPLNKLDRVNIMPNTFFNVFFLKLVNKLKPYFKNFWIFIYIIVFIAVSQLILKNHAQVGSYINGLAIAALLGLSVFYEKARNLALSAAIIPVSTLISLSLPNISSFAQTVVFYDSILVLGLIYRYLFILESPQENSRIKLRNYAIFIPLMAVIGQLLGLIGYAMLRHHYPFHSISLPFVAVSVTVFAFTEETLFRGLIQNKGRQVIHPIFAAILTVALFVLSTIDHTTLLAPLFALILGSVLSITYYFRQNLVLTGTINLATKLAYVGLVAAFVFR